MSSFTAAEIEYLNEQAHGRLATVGGDGQPHVVPVAYRYDADSGGIDISGPSLTRTRKFREASENDKVAFVVDDRPPSAQRPRGIEIRGIAEILAHGGKRIHPGFVDACIRIHPHRIGAWGIEAPDSRPSRAVTPA